MCKHKNHKPVFHALFEKNEWKYSRDTKDKVLDKIEGVESKESMQTRCLCHRFKGRTVFSSFVLIQSYFIQSSLTFYSNGFGGYAFTESSQ